MSDLASLTSEQCDFENVAYVQQLLEETDDAVLHATLVRALKLEDSSTERHRTDAWVDAAKSDLRLVQQHMFPPLACSRVLTLLQAARRALVEHPGPHHSSVAACGRVLKAGAVQLVAGAEYTRAQPYYGGGTPTSSQGGGAPPSDRNEPSEQQQPAAADPALPATAVRLPSLLTGYDAGLVVRHAHREILTPARLLRATHRLAPRASRRAVLVPLAHPVQPVPLACAVPLSVAHDNQVAALLAEEGGQRDALGGEEGVHWEEARERHAVEAERADGLREQAEAAADGKRALGRDEFASVMRSFALTVKQGLRPAGDIEARLRGLETAFAEPVAVGGKK
ncbi:hypothetical protein DIPPA_19480 [Diplonema papillatum]|nr:hypothetical protein DIPPA_19480 [Diplonema papillatum]